MQKIDFYFKIKRCKSGNLENYPDGDVPFVSNTTLNNGVVRYVSTLNDKEIIDDVPCITINGFGFATIQITPFIGSGNGGVYVSALIPKVPMNTIELSYYAGQINLQSWRFSYGRRAIKRRIIELKLQEFSNDKMDSNLLSDLKNNIILRIDNILKHAESNS